MTNGVTLSDCSGPKPMIQDWSCVGVSAQSVLIQVAISAVTNTDITGIIQISKGHCLLGTLLIPPIAWDIANEVLNRAHRMNKSRPCQHLPTASWSLGLACIHQQQINCLIVVRGSKDVVDIWPLGFHENGQHWFACGSSTSSLSRGQEVIENPSGKTLSWPSTQMIYFLLETMQMLVFNFCVGVVSKNWNQGLVNCHDREVDAFNKWCTPFNGQEIEFHHLIALFGWQVSRSSQLERCTSCHEANPVHKSMESRGNGVEAICFAIVVVGQCCWLGQNFVGILEPSDLFHWEVEMDRVWLVIPYFHFWTIRPINSQGADWNSYGGQGISSILDSFSVNSFSFWNSVLRITGLGSANCWNSGGLVV